MSHPYYTKVQYEIPMYLLSLTANRVGRRAGLDRRDPDGSRELFSQINGTILEL